MKPLFATFGPGGHSAFLGLLAVAVVIHLPIFGDALNPDATTYLAVSDSLVRRGSLHIETTLVPQHPPLVPLLLIPFELAFGFNEFAVHVFEMTSLVILLILLYALSRELGPALSLIPSTLLALDPVLYLNMSEGRGLCLLMILGLVTLTAIWKGLTDERWLVVAAASSSLAYLAADSVGYLFVAAGIAGVLWRFRYDGWQVFLNRWYLLAMSLFASVVLAWTVYNLTSSGTPYTDPRVVGYLGRLVFSTPLHVQITTIGGLGLYFMIYLGQTSLPFVLHRDGRSILSSLPRRSINDQRIGAMALFAALTIAISATVAAAFILYEPLRNLGLAYTYLRYAAVAAPIAYLGFGKVARAIPKSRKGWLAPLAVALAILLVQFVPQAISRDQSRDWFRMLQRDLLARNLTIVYSDFAIYLRYNIVGIIFLSVDKGYATRTVNITAQDVPLGAPLLTFIYAPATYDERIEGLYLIYHFDPRVHSPFVNLYYRE